MLPDGHELMALFFDGTLPQLADSVKLGVFYNGKFETVHLMNEGYLKKLLNK